MGIKNVVCSGIFTDQCVSSTVRSLADESFNVLVVEDCCAAATLERVAVPDDLVARLEGNAQRRPPGLGHGWC